eukprot:SAG31_NODE_4862_length_2901_cov_12.896000_2_plen_130_part_00
MLRDIGVDVPVRVLNLVPVPVLVPVPRYLAADVEAATLPTFALPHVASPVLVSAYYIQKCYRYPKMLFTYLTQKERSSDSHSLLVLINLVLRYRYSYMYLFAQVPALLLHFRTKCVYSSRYQVSFSIQK